VSIQPSVVLCWREEVSGGTGSVLEFFSSTATKEKKAGTARKEFGEMDTKKKKESLLLGLFRLKTLAEKYRKKKKRGEQYMILSIISSGRLSFQERLQKKEGDCVCVLCRWWIPPLDGFLLASIGGLFYKELD
jgi:hypothetical protein